MNQCCELAPLIKPPHDFPDGGSLHMAFFIKGLPAAQIKFLLSFRFSDLTLPWLAGGHIMKIVVLDGYTLNPGDLSWDEVKSIGNCEIYDRTPPADVLARAADAEILLTNKTKLSREHFE